MPISAPQWTEFLTCPICSHDFNDSPRQPISLGCGHTVCKSCLSNLHRTVCPFDQSTINLEVELLPINYALLQLLGYAVPLDVCPEIPRIKENESHYKVAKMCIEELALYLKPIVPRVGSSSENGNGGLTNGTLSRPMHRKLVTLVNCQLAEEEGCARVMRAVRSLGERTVLEFILLHQNSAQLSQHLWIAVRTRGCQFLGPAMQEDALKYILLALEGGEALSRKVLVLFVVQRLETVFPQASKTSIGHVVQLLYRASCFKVTKRDDESSLMQLKENYRNYDALRREHDSQIVQIALEAGLRISPEQWSALLYGDQTHKSHMQSIIDKLQTPESFASSIQELTIALQRSSDPAQLGRLREHFELLSGIDGSPDAKAPTWQDLEDAIKAVNAVVQGLVEFTKTHGMRVKTTSEQPIHSKFKTSMCRDFAQRGSCPRGTSCTFAHSDDELDKYRRKAKAIRPSGSSMVNARGSGGLSDQQQQQYPSPSHCNEDSLENGHGSRNGSMRSTSHCLQGNDRDYAVPSSSYGPLIHRSHNNHNSHDVVVQQLRNLSMYPSQSMYSGQENGYNSTHGSLGSSDSLTPPHNSEQSFNYNRSYYTRQPIDGRSNGYSSMNGNGQMNGHIDGVGRQGPTRTSPLTVEELNGVNCMNGMNKMNVVNGMNGVNGMMNGHSDYVICQTRLDDARLRKSNLVGYSPRSSRYRCSPFAGSPNGFSQFHSGSYYAHDMNPGFGPVGTRMLDIDRYGGFLDYQRLATTCCPTRNDPRIEFNPSFHPRPVVIETPGGMAGRFGRRPADPDSDGVHDIQPSSPTATDVFPTEDSSSQAEDCSFTRPHLNSGSSGVGSSESSHYSPSGSPLQHSPDVWTEKGEKEINPSVWSNGTLGTQVWKPLEDHENDDSAVWPLLGRKHHNHHALLDIDISSCSGYWSDPEILRYRQIKHDEVIARQLQDDEAPKVVPSAPPEIYEEKTSDARIALELQNMENDDHEVKVEKERKEFAERTEKEFIKMKQEEEDRQMAIRVQNEEDDVKIVTDKVTIERQARLYKEKVERMKQNHKEHQESKDRELAEALVYEDAYHRGYMTRPDPELLKPVTYPVKIIPRGSRVTTSPSSTAFDIADSAIP